MKSLVEKKVIWIYLLAGVLVFLGTWIYTTSLPESTTFAEGLSLAIEESLAFAYSTIYFGVAVLASSLIGFIISKKKNRRAMANSFSIVFGLTIAFFGTMFLMDVFSF